MGHNPSGHGPTGKKRVIPASQDKGNHPFHLKNTRYHVYQILRMHRSAGPDTSIRIRGTNPKSSLARDDGPGVCYTSTVVQVSAVNILCTSK